MRLQRLLLVCAAAVSAAACSSDTGPTATNDQQYAAVRFVNAIPDTNKIEPRFIDQVAGSPYFGQLAYRDISAYQPVSPGARHMRVFLVDPAVDAGATEGSIDVVSKFYVDTTITFEAGKYYTVLHAGYARAGKSPQQGLIVLTDDRSAAPSSTQIAVRVINTAPTLTSADVYSGSAATGTALFSGVGYGTSSTYKLLSTGALTLTAAASGSTTAAASAAAPAGSPPASISQSALGGYSIGGSMLTAFVFSPSVTGSLAKAATSSSVIWIQDNFPQMPTG